MANYRYAMGAAIAAFVIVLLEFILVPVAMQIGSTAFTQHVGNSTSALVISYYPGVKGILQVMPILIGAVGVVVVAGLLYKSFE